MAKAKMIGLGAFREDPDNVSEATDEEIARLAAKLKRVPMGLTAMRIAYVTDDPGGGCMVISGNKRLRCLKAAYGEDGEDAILEHAKLLAQIDEFDTLLRAIAEDRGGNKESLVRFLLQTYTSGGSFIRRRQKARTKDAQDSRSYCHRPGLTIFGTGFGSCALQNGDKK